jgi:hypothetical protein
VSPSGSELGLEVGWWLDEPRYLSRRPHLLFIGIVRRGPPTSVGFGAPDQGADQRPKLAVGPNLVEINLTDFNFRRTSSWLLFEKPSRVSRVEMHGTMKTRFEWHFIFF